MHSTVSAKVVSCWIVLMLLTAAEGASTGARKISRPINVGMIALLASPEKYNGKVISTVGFLNIGSMPENDNLWLYEADGKSLLYMNTIALDLSDDQRKEFMPLNHTYVLITGTFRSNRPESAMMNSGTIVRIRRVDGWQPHHPSLPAKGK
jgi:hypothetical protein